MTPCRCSRANPGQAIQLRGPCSFCNERRCRNHCRCARLGQLRGWAAGRAGPLGNAAVPKAKAKAAPKAAAAPPVPAPIIAAPVGAPAMHTRVDVLPLDQFMLELCRDIRQAATVVLASYAFDHPGLTDLLERRLWGNTPFRLQLILDKAVFEGGEYHYQHSRVSRLREAGAVVYLCRGAPPHGKMHAKACVVDRRRLYTGSSNFTYKSQYNVELPLRVAGPPVADVLQVLADVCRGGRVWGGN